MELPEWMTRKAITVIVLMAVVSGVALFVVMPQDQLQPASVWESKTVVETEPETVVDEESVILESETIPENITNMETATETIPETPILTPAPTEEIPPISEKEIKDKGDRFNADPGTPVPAKGTISGTVTEIPSGNVLDLSGVLVKLRGVDTHDEDDPDFNQWREALMRICPVGTLVLHNNPQGTPDSQGRISATVWCYGFPHAPPLATANEVMTEADFDIIGRGCSASSDTRLLGCTS